MSVSGIVGLSATMGYMPIGREIGESIGSQRRRDRLAGEAFVTQLNIATTTCTCGLGKRVDGLLASVTCHHKLLTPRRGGMPTTSKK